MADMHIDEAGQNRMSVEFKKIEAEMMGSAKREDFIAFIQELRTIYLNNSN